LKQIAYLKKDLRQRDPSATTASRPAGGSPNGLEEVSGPGQHLRPQFDGIDRLPGSADRLLQVRCHGIEVGDRHASFRGPIGIGAEQAIGNDPHLPAPGQDEIRGLRVADDYEFQPEHAEGYELVATDPSPEGTVVRGRPNSQDAVECILNISEACPVLSSFQRQAKVQFQAA
jgi:hypothetical protein